MSEELPEDQMERILVAVETIERSLVEKRESVEEADPLHRSQNVSF